MPAKSYGQICPVARSLDLLGDRWTLLLIREFLLGPKRFKDLLAVLPAMGANRLSDRLAMLVSSGVIEHVPVAASRTALAYQLTAMGEGLRKPVLALGIWGLGLPVDDRIDPSTMRAELIALSLTSVIGSPERLGPNAVSEFEIGNERFHTRPMNGELVVRSGPSLDPVGLGLSCDVATFLELVLGELKPADALENGRARLFQGDLTALEQVFDVLAYRLG